MDMGNMKELSSIYISIRSRLMKAVSHIVPPKEVEDIVQETYVKACQIDSAKTINCPQSFMFVTAKNLALDYVKKAENRLSSSIDDLTELNHIDFDPEQNEPCQTAISNSEFATFCEAVRHLPVACRRTFVLKKVYGYSQKEIAKSLNISQSTVEKHIATGIKRCMFYMQKHNSKDGTSYLSRSTDKHDENPVSLPKRKEGKQ